MMSQMKHGYSFWPDYKSHVLDRVILAKLSEIIQECQKKRIDTSPEPLSKLYVFRKMRSILRAPHAVAIRQLERAARELPDYSKGTYSFDPSFHF